MGTPISNTMVELYTMMRYLQFHMLEERDLYYTLVNGVKWLYIQVTYQGVKYTGFSSGAYLKKV